jgi:hypothetical protein
MNKNKSIFDQMSQGTKQVKPVVTVASLKDRVKETPGIYSVQTDYAVVYRTKKVDDSTGIETMTLVRESGMTFRQAEKLNTKVHGQIHKMSGVRSFKVS